jgi:cytochrome c biogenesis protein CcmG/thiol:disulfide interchange protein DsbE
MRRLAYAAIALGLVAIVTIGLLQSGGGEGQQKSAGVPAAEARDQLAGAPPALAALHAQANELLPGGAPAVEARLEQLHGHPVVLNGWASWCGPCRFEFPFLQEASLELGRRVAFVGVDSADVSGDARAFLERYPVSYPSYEDADAKVVAALNAPRGLPWTMFFDAAGELAYLHQGGYSSKAALVADVRRYALG